MKQMRMTKNLPCAGFVELMHFVTILSKMSISCDNDKQMTTELARVDIDDMNSSAA